MATRAEIEKHYDTVGAMHALRMEDVQGDCPDCPTIASSR